VTLRDINTGQYLTVSLSTDEGRTVVHADALGTLSLERVLETHRITSATDSEWAELADRGYPAFLNAEELKNLGPMGKFAQDVFSRVPEARIRLADWSWEDPVLEVWWRGLRFSASFHDRGPVLECNTAVGRRSVFCSWSSNPTECFLKFADRMIKAIDS
jgi:hypothetical protein